MIKYICTSVLLIISAIVYAQTPVSHLPQVTLSASGEYFSKNLSVDYQLCTYWNSGAYGGWIIMDLNQQIDLKELTWWIAMTPSGNVNQELIEVSSDGANWSLAADNSGLHEENQEVHLTFSPAIQNVQYIRFSQNGTPSWFAIRQIVVNDPFYLNNTYNGMQPKVLDANGRPAFIGPNYPQTIYSSKADTYQWAKDGIDLPGETNQSLTITSPGDYTCKVSYVGNSCNIYSNESTSPPLPVRLIDFWASPEETWVNIDWQTAMEENLSHFNIERSGDGKNFKTIAKVDAVSYSDITKTYTYQDVAPLEDINFYRLKMIDFDGSYSYSKVVQTKRNSLETKVKIYPNPAKETLYLDFNQRISTPTPWKILNQLGQQILSGTFSNGSVNNEVDIHHLPKGIYYIRIQLPEQPKTIQFIKQ